MPAIVRLHYGIINVEHGTDYDYLSIMQYDGNSRLKLSEGVARQPDTQTYKSGYTMPRQEGMDDASRPQACEIWMGGSSNAFCKAISVLDIIRVSQLYPIAGSKEEVQDIQQEAVKLQRTGWQPGEVKFPGPNGEIYYSTMIRPAKTSVLEIPNTRHHLRELKPAHDKPAGPTPGLAPKAS